MGMTLTAGFQDIWNHTEATSDDDDSVAVVTGAADIPGGAAYTLEIEGAEGIDFVVQWKGPNLTANPSVIGKSVSEILLEVNDVLVTQQDVYIANVLSSSRFSDTPIPLGSFDPDSTDIEKTEALFSGDDVFYGAATAIPNPLDGSIETGDNMNGYAGNDIFWGRLGDDLIVGGSGTDTASYEGSLSQFTITQVEGVWNDSLGEGFPGWQIADGSGSEGTDRMMGVERAVFSDATIALDLDGVGGQAYRIYKAAFDRDPMDGDTGGLGYWIAQMDDGMDMVEVAARFIDSDEFRAIYGTNPTNGEFLTKVYNNVLDRDPDAGGYDWWMDQLENNPEKTWEKVLADFSESPENQANVAALIANGIVFDPWMG